MYGPTTFQILRKRNAEIRREAEMGRLAKALRRGSTGSSWWLTIPWRELRKRANGHGLSAMANDTLEC